MVVLNTILFPGKRAFLYSEQTLLQLHLYLPAARSVHLTESSYPCPTITLEARLIVKVHFIPQPLQLFL